MDKENTINLPDKIKLQNKINQNFESLNELLKSNENKNINQINKTRISKKENSNDSLWAIADDMRDKKEQGEFRKYRLAYRWAANNMTCNGKSFTWEQLETEYHKAKSRNRV